MELQKITNKIYQEIQKLDLTNGVNYINLSIYAGEFDICLNGELTINEDSSISDSHFHIKFQYPDYEMMMYGVYEMRIQNSINKLYY